MTAVHLAGERHAPPNLPRELRVAVRAILATVILLSLFSSPAPAQQAEAGDSIAALEDARAAVLLYIRQLRRTRDHPDRQQLIEVATEGTLRRLDRAQSVIPGDRWIVGQRVGVRVLAADLAEAAAATVQCGADPWWCEGLRGLVLHAAGVFDQAEVSFDQTLSTMPPAKRCEWTELIPRYLLEGDARRRWSSLSCDQRLEAEDQLWWLADPLYLVPGNDRRTEHYARLVAMELHHQWLDLENDWCDPGHHAQQIRLGWPEWWWSVEETLSGVEEGQGQRFIPHGPAAIDPFQGAGQSWSLRPSRRAEEYRPTYGSVASFEQQVAFFRRGQQILAVIAADTSGLHLAGGEDVQVASLLSPDPSALHLAIPAQSDFPERIMFQASVGDAAQMISTEILSSDGLARSRSGHRLPDAAQSVDLSDLLLFDWTEQLVPDLAMATRRMLGSTTVRKSQPLGVLWEVYGVAPGVAVDLAISVVAGDRGLMARVTDLLRITSAPQSIGLSWTEGVGEQEDEGVYPRMLGLDLSALQPGDYTLQLRARVGRIDVSRSKAIRVVE